MRDIRDVLSFLLDSLNERYSVGYDLVVAASLTERGGHEATALCVYDECRPNAVHKSYESLA